MASRKPKIGTKKMSATVQVAIITTIGTVAVALITGLFAWIQNQPENQLSPTFSPTSTVQLITSPSLTNTPTRIPYRFDWFGDELNPSNFVTVYDNRYVEISFSDDGLVISGTFVNLSQVRVGVDKILPKDFQVEVDFVPYNQECGFSVGFDDGKNWAPNYHLALSNKWVSFKRSVLADDVNYYITPMNTQYPMQAIGVTRKVVLQRVNGIAKAWIDGNLIVDTQAIDDPELAEINNFNTLVFSAVSNTDIKCSFLIKRFSVGKP